MLNCLNNSFLFVSYDNCRVNCIISSNARCFVWETKRNAVHPNSHSFDLTFQKEFQLVILFVVFFGNQTRTRITLHYLVFKKMVLSVFDCESLPNSENKETDNETASRSRHMHFIYSPNSRYLPQSVGI